MDLAGRVAAAARALRGRPEPPSHAPQLFAPGEFYSPVVNAHEVLRDPDLRRIWPEPAEDPPGLDLRGEAQLELLGALSKHRLPTGPERIHPQYDPTNDQFPQQDAALLYSMLLHLRPRRVVEVGSGWSTTVMAQAIHDGALDVALTCIDPYPVDLLQEISAITQLRPEKVEHTPLEVFEELQAGDVLFIDSSHVVKTGSDVVHQFLHVLPRLASGVVVHVHDIFLPEDYPQGWVRAGFGWNEQYLLHAFLLGHGSARVLVMNHWLSLRHPEAVAAAFGELPLHGSSVWFSA
jgi:predicted O-methyltransferase YrrM